MRGNPMRWMTRTLALCSALSLVSPVLDAEARSHKKDDEEASSDEPKKEKAKKEDADGEKAEKVVLTDKAELRAEPSLIGKVVKKLRKKEKVEFVKRSPDGKWANVRKGKVEGWVESELLEGLPPFVVAAVEKPAPPPPPPPVAPPPPPPPPKDVCPNVDGNQEFVPVGLVKDASGKCVVEKEAPPEEKAAAEEKAKAAAAPPEGPKIYRDGLKGFHFSVGGGIALLASSIQATTSSGLVPELYNYHVDNLPALGLQARLGYTYGYKWLRVGIDGGYRFGGGTSIVVQLPDRESLPTPGPGGGPQTSTLRTPRQELATTAHDADAAVSFGGYLQLPKNLELAIRLRAGMQFFGFIPELNATTPLPQELFYGPLIGALVEFQSQFVPGFGFRLDGGYIPYAVRQENVSLRDSDQTSSRGFYAGLGGAARLFKGFELELSYRVLGTSTDFAAGSIPERLLRDRDPEVQRLARAGETLVSGSRSTVQHTLAINFVFFRH